MSGSYVRVECRELVAVSRAGVRRMAVAVALLVSALLWAGCRQEGASGATGAACTAAHGGAADPCVAVAPGAEAAHDHGSGEHADAHGHDDAVDAGTPDATPAAIEAETCEHDVQIIHCDECRYETGVVKLRHDVAEALVKTAKVETGALVHRLRLTGEVALDATAVVEVLPASAGTVLSVKVALGQEVRAGDTLAVIHSSEVSEAKATYLEALTAAEISLQERERQRQVSTALTRLLAALPQGAALLRLDAEPLGDWKGRLVGAAARLDQARTVCRRETTLVQRDASSRAELEGAQRELQSAEADYAAQVEEAQLGLEIALLRAENAVRQTDVRRIAAEQRLRFFGLDAAAIGRIREMQDNESFADLTITAPRAGTITALALTRGRFVDTTQSLCTIADLTNLWVWCDLYERDLAALQGFLQSQGKPTARVQVTAFEEVFRGEVDLLGHELSEATRTLKVRVQVPAHAGRLRPGMFATVEVELPSGRTVTLAPRDAVLADEGRQFVFTHWRDDLWLRRHVVLGESAGEQVEIVSGLEPGVDVVVSGGFMLKSDVLREKMGAGCAD